jgi:hypothetical protein
MMRRAETRCGVSADDGYGELPVGSGSSAREGFNEDFVGSGESVFDDDLTGGEGHRAQRVAVRDVTVEFDPVMTGGGPFDFLDSAALFQSSGFRYPGPKTDRGDAWITRGPKPTLVALGSLWSSCAARTTGAGKCPFRGWAQFGGGHRPSLQLLDADRVLRQLDRCVAGTAERNEHGDGRHHVGVGQLPQDLFHGSPRTNGRRTRLLQPLSPNSTAQWARTRWRRSRWCPNRASELGERRVSILDPPLSRVWPCHEPHEAGHTSGIGTRSTASGTRLGARNLSIGESG